METYIALARKYRPRTYSDLVGHTSLISSLHTSINAGKIHHAYLFTGTRGVGKTTIARILAKSLNCESGITGSPCLKCDNCLDIENNSSLDIVEIDAASNTKVEDMRSLLDKVKYLPAKSRFKVYIIDEVHMLSTHSFNAILKTLEEPPSHVKFILATTEKQKIPATILSRCLQYYLKSPEDKLLIDYLKKVLTSENISYEDEAIADVVYSANGSVRDALSLLEQAVSFGSLSATTTRSLLGLGDTNTIYDVLAHIFRCDAIGALTSFEKLYTSTLLDASWFLNVLLETIHLITISKHTKTPAKNAYIADLLTISPSEEELHLMYQIIINSKKDLLYVKNDKNLLEMTLLRLISFAVEPSIEKPSQSAQQEIKTEQSPTLLQAPVIETSVKLPEEAKKPEKVEDPKKKLLEAVGLELI